MALNGNKDPQKNILDNIRSLLGFKERQKNALPPKARFSIWYFLIAILLFTYLQQYFFSAKVETIPYSQFKHYIAEGPTWSRIWMNTRSITPDTMRVNF
jgi:hypothetical protein